MDNIILNNKSISIYNTFPNETVKKDSQENSPNSEYVTRFFMNNPSFDNANFREILKIIYDLGFATSKQITYFLNENCNISLSQNKVQDILNKASKKIAYLYSLRFFSDIREDGTNIQVYTINDVAIYRLIRAGILNSRNGREEYRHQVYLCKSHLIRNQYIAKLKESSKVKSMNINNFVEIRAMLTYKLEDDSTHYLFPIRKSWDKNMILNLLKNYNLDDPYNSYVILGEDINHIFNVYVMLLENNINLENFYFTTDLRLFNKNINDMFAKFEINEKTKEVEIHDIKSNLM